MRKILIIGACGQIGSDLTEELRLQLGALNVVAADIREGSKEMMESGPFEILNVLDKDRLYEIVNKHNITEVCLLAAILSGNAEKKPMESWQINMDGLFHVLNLAKDKSLKVFWPSSIAVFGPTTPRINTPQYTVMEPTTVYGISKQAGERWCEYYFKKFNVDVRSIRYPGLISYKTEAGGGTTDYAVEIFYEAVKNGKYECFLSENTRLPMMFMPDAIKATLDLMNLPKELVNIRSSYNVGSINFTPKEIALEIKKHIPDFEITYKPDFRQEIADSWPQSIDDSIARSNDGWKHNYSLSLMTEVMLREIRKKFNK